MLRLGVLITLCCALAACTTIDPSKDHVSAIYFGIVRIATPAVSENAAAASAAPVTALDTRAFGLRIQNGVSAGYFHDQRYEVPLDCRVLIVVQDKDQLDFITHQFADFKEGICSTIKSS